jgi:hypothetical protein
MVLEYYSEDGTVTSEATFIRSIQSWLKSTVKISSVAFDDIEDLVIHPQTADQKTARVVLPTSSKNDPYQLAAYIALVCLELALIHDHDIEFHDPLKKIEFLELCTLHIGLAPIILNSISVRPKLFRWQTVHTTSGVLRHYTTQGFASEYSELLQQQRSDIQHEAVGLLRPSVYEFAPPILRLMIRDSNPASRSIDLERRKQAIAVIKRSSMASTALFVLGMGAYVYLQRPPQLSKEQAEQKQKIQLLKKQYQICTASVTQKENVTDPNDLFLQGSLDADKSRCESIRNQHNYEIQKLNDQLKN